MTLDPTPVTRAQGPGLVAALTLDDGPNGATTQALLDVLAELGVVATFCVVGCRLQARGAAATLRRTVAEGHALGNHAMSYDDMGSWSTRRVETDLRDTLAVIRRALDDPEAGVPFFRAPNGSWGATARVAVALGMQPLAVVNTIDDWRTQHVPTLARNMRAAIRPGEIVVAHDGGGDRWGTVAALKTVLRERLDDGWSFTLPVGGTEPSTAG